MAGRPNGGAKGHAEVTDTELKRELEAIKRELADAIRDHDGTVTAKRGVALLQERMWNQYALRELHLLRLDEAAKASREAARHGELAVKLSRSTLADRVAVLERAAAEGKRKASSIAVEARRRKG